MRSELPLSEACELIVDCPHNTAPKAEVAFAYAVGTKAIGGGRINFADARPVDQATYRRWIARATPEEGDIILCREAPVGPLAPVPKHPLVCLGQRTVLLRPNREAVDPRFLLYGLLAPATQSRLREISEGSTVAHLNVADIRRFAVPIPPLEEQRRIALVLGALDDKIDSNQRLAWLLEQVVQAEFQARFVEFIGIENLEDSELGQIPVGWHAGLLSDIGVVQRDMVKGASDLPYVGLDLMPRSSTVLTEWRVENAPTGQAALFGVGDILFGKLRPYFRKVVVAPIAGRSSTEILVLRPGRPEYYGVLLGHVASAAFIEHCVAVSRGTRMPRAEWKDASVFKVAIPPGEDAAAFTALVQDLYAKIRRLTHESRTLASIRDVLLPRLVSGEIRVSDTADPGEVIEPLVDEAA